MRRCILLMHLFRSHTMDCICPARTYKLLFMRLQRFCIRCIRSGSKPPALGNLRNKLNAFHFPVSSFLHIHLSTFAISFPPRPSPAILLAHESHTI